MIFGCTNTEWSFSAEVYSRFGNACPRRPPRAKNSFNSEKSRKSKKTRELLYDTGNMVKLPLDEAINYRMAQERIRLHETAVAEATWGSGGYVWPEGQGRYIIDIMQWMTWSLSKSYRLYDCPTCCCISNGEQRAASHCTNDF